MDLFVCFFRYNREILRQFSYDEHKKEDNSLFDIRAKCLLCVGGDKCEICSIKSKFKSELEGIVNRNEPYHLSDLEAHLMSASNIESSDTVGVDVGNACKSGGGKQKNILPVLLKIKQKRNLLQRNASTPNDNQTS